MRTSFPKIPSDKQVHAAYSPVPQVGVSKFKVSYFNQSIRNVLSSPLFFVTFIILNLVQGQFVSNVSKVGTTAAPFLGIEVGSRAIGMGGAFVAVANDATAIYWNPAGIARLSKSEVTLIHTNWLVGTNFDFAGIVLPMGRMGSIAVSITSLSTEEMEVRTVQNPEGTGEKFSYGDLSAGLSYAKNLTNKFSIGVNVKYISQRIWHMNAQGYALDIGTLFRTEFNGMMIGMSISNFGGSMKLEGKDVFVNYDEAPQFGGSNERIPAYKKTDEFPLPLLFRVGIAMDLLKNSRNQLTIAADAAHPNDNTEYINLGMEYIFRDQVALRFGYKNLFTLDTEEGFTAGVGTKLKLAGGVALKIDYAFQDFGRLHNAQRFSLGFEF
ncbi:MAG: PorV/PorQ family protein [Candidatus Marinimicrobia bacterium]|nr:PorV/PorQ family protein [Candidatus Neomarinimicrobiota bacterium]